MSNVRELNPTNLANVPAMLRFWAAEMEAGREPTPKAVLMIMVKDPDEPPEVCAFGQTLTRLEEIGALAACTNQAMSMELVPNHG